MHWQDEGFLLSKNNFNENSIIIEVFTSKFGKYSGIVYGGSSRKQKRIQTQSRHSPDTPLQLSLRNENRVVARNSISIGK